MSRKRLNIGLVLISVLLFAMLFTKYGTSYRPMHGDALGYYSYLPALLIHNNLKEPSNITDEFGVDEFITNSIESMTIKSDSMDYPVMKYTYGNAFMEFPFFFLAHGYEKLIGGNPSGYAESYVWMIKLASAVYAFLGLLFTFLSLKNFFKHHIALIVTLSLYLGSNLLWFSTFQAGMAHVPLFFLYSLLLYFTIKIHRNPSLPAFLIIGFTVGMITIIRPTDIICVFIPLLYGVWGRETITQKMAWAKQNRYYIILAMLVATIPFVPQFAYWYSVTGNLIFYSYGDESFHWMDSRMWDGLFGAGNGWLTYSPLMAFSLLGLFLMIRTNALRKLIPMVVVLFIVHIFIIYAWWCYYYINGLGSRPMIHIYPVLAISMAAFIQWILQRSWYLKGGVLLVSVFFIAQNISYSIQYKKWILIPENSKHIYNWNMLFRYDLEYNDLVVNSTGELQPELSEVEHTRTLASKTFKESPFVVSQDSHYARPGVDLIVTDSLANSSADWIRVYGNFLTDDWISSIYHNHVIVFEVIRAGRTEVWKSCTINNKIGLLEQECKHKDFNLLHTEAGIWGKVAFFIPFPTLEQGDKITVYLWNNAGKKLYVDELGIEAWKDLD